LRIIWLVLEVGFIFFTDFGPKTCRIERNGLSLRPERNNLEQTTIVMSQQQLRSYRLNSLEEPTDEMLQAIMEGVQETARQSSLQAEGEINRRFREMEERVARRRKMQQSA